MTAPAHHPTYLYCSSPDDCCWTYDPLAVLCEVDGEDWPCSTKRSHCSAAKAARLARWASGRVGRAALVEPAP